jgi:RNA polymerase sigma-54 factor
MRLELGQEARLEQTLSPRLIQFYELLQCPLAELEATISREVAENPALEIVETAFETAEVEAPLLPAWTGGGGGGGGEGEVDDLFSRLPAPVSLKDHLRWHFLALAKTPDEQRIGLYLIDELSADGYLESSIGEAAMILEAGVVKVEQVLELVQQLEPPGVGARDLRECLQIQVRQFAEQGRAHTVAQRLLEECWELFTRRKFADCARRLGVSPAAVEDGAEFLRANCSPYPGRAFRDPWQADAGVVPVRPEVAIRSNAAAPPRYVAQALLARGLMLRVDRAYHQLDRAVREGAQVAEDEALHVQTLVRRAREFITHLTQRAETVRRVAQEAANEQEDFLEHGPTRLRPLTRQEIARRLGVHESTVGRAVNGKWVELPSRDSVPFETFFDSAQPLRIALEQILAAEDPAHPFSDQALAERLVEMGFDVARRTVTKYRLALRIPPAHQRRGT